MKQRDVADSIGKRVSVNGIGDLAMDGEARPLVDDWEGLYDIRFIKQTKGGLAYLQVDGKHCVAIPIKNVDLYAPSN